MWARLCLVGPWTHPYRDALIQPFVAVGDFDIMPGCYSASVPPIIAGYWYDYFPSTQPSLRWLISVVPHRIAPVIVESKFCHNFLICINIT